MIQYTFTVQKVDKPNKVMEVIYRATDKPEVLVCTRIPYVGETLSDVISMYAPVRYWEELDLELEDIQEGIHGSVDMLTFTDTPETRKAKFIAAIQSRLDAFASTRGYDSILSACSYATSTDPKFAAEGQRAVALRDATWSAAYALFDKVTSGEIAEPSSFAEIEPLLPELSWIN